jgi:hypothetical protein
MLVALKPAAGRKSKRIFSFRGISNQIERTTRTQIFHGGEAPNQILCTRSTSNQLSLFPGDQALISRYDFAVFDATDGFGFRHNVLRRFY